MKLRIRDNSLRFRLAKSEVAKLDDNGVIQATTRFPGDKELRFSVQLDGAAPTTMATFDEGLLCVIIPRAIGSAWAQSDEISLQAAVDLPEGELSILIEKDFACLTPREGEDESDLYPHPLQGQTTC